MNQDVTLFLQVTDKEILVSVLKPAPQWVQICFIYCSMVVFLLHISEYEEQIEYSNDERR